MDNKKQDFQMLGRELDQAMERRWLDEKLPLYLRKRFIVLIGLLVMGFLVIRLVTPSRLTFKSVSELPAKTAQEFQFKWTEENFSELRKGTTINDVLESYGRPSSSRDLIIAGDPGVELTYDQGAFSGQFNQGALITLIFKNIDEPILSSKSFYRLPVLPYTDQKSDTASDEWTEKVVQGLKVGSTDGLGGDTLEDILDKYGYPKSYETSGYNDDRQIIISYHFENRHLYLTFYKQSQAQEYRLSHKEWRLQ
ncbi:hypothetical protein AB6M97_01205 [Streptococcus hillyeri]|uniref:Uncharacterized protein n=1 Tax=Streptococcus hillyeri TaxID=2282420 RepID=A0A3L9DSL2_9STRE|nr:hypothetical protein [Streptococcus hillyeri]RLY03965.1 hypothetical protein EAF07_04060 [Streptococcus hillyeri]